MWWILLLLSFSLPILPVAGQAYLAPANLGWNVDPYQGHAHPHHYDDDETDSSMRFGKQPQRREPNDYVPNIPGLNPNLAPWLQTRKPRVHHRGIGHLDKKGNTIWEDGTSKSSSSEHLVSDRSSQSKSGDSTEHEPGEEAGESGDGEAAAAPSESSAPPQVSPEEGFGDVPAIDAPNTAAPSATESVSEILVTVSESSPLTVIAPVPKPIGGEEEDLDDGLLDPFSPRRKGRKAAPLEPIILTTTWTVVASGAIQTHTLQRTVQPADTKIRSCIFGCTSVTHQATVVTVLPLRLPCSLVSCPPCSSCVSSTVKVSVCPFISTVTPKGYVTTTSLSNGPTVTIVRSTVTRTACTATRTITARLDCSQCSLSMASLASISESAAGGSLEEALLMLAALPSERVPTRHAFTVTQTVTEGSITTVTSTLMPVVASATSGVCSTFVVCNPGAFTCPAQATGLSNLAPIIQAMVDGRSEKVAALGKAIDWQRPRSPNGAFLDGGKLLQQPRLDDGLAKAGGLGAGALGPDGIFHRAIDASVVGNKPVAASTSTSSVEASTSVVYVTVTASAPDSEKSRKGKVGIKKPNSSSQSKSSPWFLLTSSLLLLLAVTRFR